MTLMKHRKCVFKNKVLEIKGTYTKFLKIKILFYPLHKAVEGDSPFPIGPLFTVSWMKWTSKYSHDWNHPTCFSHAPCHYCLPTISIGMKTNNLDYQLLKRNLRNMWIDFWVPSWIRICVQSINIIRSATFWATINHSPPALPYPLTSFLL